MDQADPRQPGDRSSGGPTVSASLAFRAVALATLLLSAAPSSSASASPTPLTEFARPHRLVDIGQGRRLNLICSGKGTPPFCSTLEEATGPRSGVWCSQRSRATPGSAPMIGRAWATVASVAMGTHPKRLRLSASPKTPPAMKPIKIRTPGLGMQGYRGPLRCPRRVESGHPQIDLRPDPVRGAVPAQCRCGSPGRLRWAPPPTRPLISPGLNASVWTLSTMRPLRIAATKSSNARSDFNSAAAA